MKAWKESASLILAARNGKNSVCQASPSAYNYKLLCLKRHQTSSFMPGTYVFPGGEVHPADADLKWHKLFSNFGFDVNSFVSLSSSTATLRPPILHTRQNELPREVSLRVTAIRETFEECGVLICKRSREQNESSDWSRHLEVSGNELQEWQARVHDDATEFYTMCEKFKCYPDLWSLHDWSNWLTPTYFEKKRFDTMFYLTCMPTLPPAAYESIEMEDLKWDTPENLISPSPKIMLPPPQYYEISRIAKFESIENLLDFAVNRSKKGVQQNMPVKVNLKDGHVHVLPGDSMYPEDVSILEKQVIDRKNITISEFRETSSVQNRVEFSKFESMKIIVQNFESVDGHLPPVQLENA